MTFSIVGRCAETGQLGIAISSSSIAVGARCPWLRAGVGAVASQNVTLPALGPQILDLLEAGAIAPLVAGPHAVHQPLVEQLQSLVGVTKAVGVHADLLGRHARSARARRDVGRCRSRAGARSRR